MQYLYKYLICSFNPILKTLKSLICKKIFTNKGIAYISIEIASGYYVLVSGFKANYSGYFELLSGCPVISSGCCDNHSVFSVICSGYLETLPGY